tara:strand:- start:513 stop:818 length:306 start_codon:yes stop_codon:yes gene_type:complete
MSTTTKTIGSRVNNEIHTLFTDVYNNEGITMSQKINQLVTDCTTLPCKTANKIESEPRDSLSKFLNTLENKSRQEKKIRVIDSKKEDEEKTKRHCRCFSLL